MITDAAQTSVSEEIAGDIHSDTLDRLIDFIFSPKIFISAIIIAAAFLIWFVIKKSGKRFFKRKKPDHRKETNIRFIMTILKYLIFIFAIVAVLELNGVDVTSFVTGLGVAGIVVGFALQDMLKDLIMGINIVWDEFFSVGDVVKYGDIIGKVVDFNIKVTKISDLNTGNLVTISNRNISEVEIVSDWLAVRVPSPYEIPAQRMRKICAGISEKISALENVKSCDFLGTTDFQESRIDYLIIIHCPPEFKLSVRRASLGIIQDVLAEENIDIPFNQLDVHINGAQ